MDRDESLNISHLTSLDTVSTGLMSDALFMRIQTIMLGLDVVVATVATIGNVITILVYKRLGFADSTNISLAALSVSDLGVAITTFSCVAGTLLPRITDASFTSEIFMISAASPHVLFTRSSALITTYVSVERYLCVSMPLKVKSIISPKRTLVSMVIIFAATFSIVPITYFRYPIGWRFYTERNKTLLGVLIVTDKTELLFGAFAQLYISVFLPVFTFFTVLICTALLALSLQKSKEWRDANKSTRQIQEENNLELSSSKSRETRAVQMVISVATVFIISSIPSSIHMISVFVVPGFDLTGRYSNLFAITGMSFLIVDCINCSANVCIYYKMSSKFGQAMFALLNKRSI